VLWVQHLEERQLQQADSMAAEKLHQTKAVESRFGLLVHASAPATKKIQNIQRWDIRYH
jgi:hypothetical protein